MSKQTLQSQPNSSSLWYDADKNKYYLINNDTGKMARVNKTGEYIKKFNSRLTGRFDYKERIQKASGIIDYMPMKVQCLNIDSKTLFYTPQNDKFESYTQFPRPRTQPYFNQDKDLDSLPEKRNRIQEQEKQIKFTENEHNPKLFNYKDLKASNIGAWFLTGTVNDSKQVQQSGKIKVLAEKQHTKFIKLQENSTKVINGRPLTTPNTQRFNKTTSLQLINKDKIKDEKQNTEIVDQKVNTMRYTDKVKSVVQKSNSFNILPKNNLDTLTKFYQIEQHRDKNIEQMEDKFENVSFKTFNKQIKINFGNQQSMTNLGKTTADFHATLKKFKSEQDGLIIPQPKEKHALTAKYRFPYTIMTTKGQYKKDMDLLIQNFKEEIEEKVDQKKIQNEKFRSECNKQVIGEQLKQTLKKEMQENQFDTIYRR